MNRVPLACTLHQISKRVKSACIFFIHSHPPMAFVVSHTYFSSEARKNFCDLFFFFPTRITCSGVHLKKKSKPQVLFRSAPLSYPIHKRPVYRVNAWNMSLELRNTANCMF